MSVKVIDHSTSGVHIGGTLKANGIHGIIRYAAAGRGNVNITPGEIQDLRANGIAIGIVNEHDADYLLGGNSVGKQCAKEAQQIARACGLPDGVVYMAGDFDATFGGPTYPGSSGDKNMQKIKAAMEGAAEGIGNANVGFYGGYFAIDYLVHHAPWIKYYWQTPGWSEHLIHSTVDIYQGDLKSRQPVYQRFGGVSVDLNYTMSTDWGQRTQRPDSPNPAGHFNADLSLLANNGQWDIHGTESHDVHFGEDEALYTLAIGVYTGGKRRGQWVKKPMPKNWTPPGGW